MIRKNGKGKLLRLLACMLVLGLICSACGSQTPSQGDSGQNGTSQTGDVSGGNSQGEDVPQNDEDSKENDSEAKPAEGMDTSDMFSKRDYKTEYQDKNVVQIQLNGDTAQADGNGVKINGSTITIVSEGTYILSGTLQNGQIRVEAGDQDKIQLVLAGVSIHSETTAPICVMEADKVFITLEEGAKNVLTNGGTFVAGVRDTSTVDGTVFSKQDMTINGSGSLAVESPVGHGIVCKDDLVITGGVLTISAAEHGLDINDSLRMDGGSLTVAAGKDGIHVENSDNPEKGFVYVADGTMDMVCEGDGISAGFWMQIDSGQFTLLTGGGSVNGTKQSSDNWGGFPGGGFGGPGGYPGGDRGGGSKPGSNSSSGGSTSGSGSSGTDADASTSIKGLKAVGDLIINGGTFSMDTADDAVHSNASVTVNGGTFAIASGDDGFHADDTLVIADGVIDISKSYEGLEGLHIVVSGGNISMVCTDDGINAAGGTDESGYGGRGDTFGRGGGFPGGQGGFPGGFGSGNSNGSIQITGGVIYAKASGDGMDANGTLEISGGHVTICGPSSGDTATLDFDVSGVITGGTFIGTGGTMMAQSFSDATQGVFAVSVGTQAAGTPITLADSQGKELFSYVPELDYAIVILSSPEMVKGEMYTITVGNQSGTLEAQ